MTDFEFRVWWTYELAADDYGVMRGEAVVLQSANQALAKRPRAVVMRALERLITVGLVESFTHQGILFVCQRDWQDFQKVRYPRETHEPMPPGEVLARCTEATQTLFSQRLTKASAGFSAADEAGFSAATDELSTAPPFQKSCGNISEILPHLPRAGTREEAKGRRLPANGKRQIPASLAEPFARFWAAYPRKVDKEAAVQEFITLAPDAALLERMLAAIHEQRASAQWLKDGGQYVPYPRAWLHRRRWQDESHPQQQIAKRTIAAAQAVKEFMKS